MKPPPPKPRFAPLALFALSPFLVVLAFARIPGAGRGGGIYSFPAPVRVIEGDSPDPTSARRLLSPVLNALPGPAGFSAAPLRLTAVRLNLIPDQPSMEALPPLIPAAPLPQVGVTRVFSRAAEFNRRLDAPPVFGLDLPMPSTPAAAAAKGAGFTIRFNHGLPADLFPEASLTGVGEKFPPSTQAWRMEAAVSVDPPGLVTSVLCAAEDEPAPGVAEAVSRAIRAWRTAPVAAPVRGIVTIHYAPPKTPAPTLPAGP
jgi:hypothetical protein